MARQEYEGLETLRRYNLVGSPHHVIRPLGVSRDINGVLAVEYYPGEEFSQAIARATRHGDDAHLYWRLKALAYFLATQHNRTANGATVDFDPDRTNAMPGCYRPGGSGPRSWQQPHNLIDDAVDIAFARVDDHCALDDGQRGYPARSLSSPSRSAMVFSIARTASASVSPISAARRCARTAGLAVK